MTPHPFMKSSPLCLEFSRSALKILAGTDGAEFPLERAGDGRLTATCHTRLTAELRGWLNRLGRTAAQTAWCAIDARGVSLRCLNLPAVAEAALPQVVRLQIESEFPIPPEDLAWGYQLLGEPERQPDGSRKQAVLVAAVKKEVVADYATLLATVGLTGVFTLAALARVAFCQLPPVGGAVLEWSAGGGELVVYEPPKTILLRHLPGTEPNHASSLGALAKNLRQYFARPRLWVPGNENLAIALSRELPADWQVEAVPVTAGSGISSATLGLQTWAAGQGTPPLTLQAKPAAAPKPIASPALVQWGVRAGVLLLAVLLLPVLEAYVMTGPLTAKLARFQARANELKGTVDRELDFLQYLKQNQPPCLAAIYVMSQAAPQGMNVESLSLNRKGDVVLRGSLRNGQQVAEFRAKLIASGFFASVTVEEQNPTPDHQKVNFHLTGQWKPLVVIQNLPVGPKLETPASPTNSPATNAPAAIKSSPSTNAPPATNAPPVGVGKTMTNPSFAGVAVPKGGTN